MPEGHHRFRCPVVMPTKATLSSDEVIDAKSVNIGLEGTTVTADRRLERGAVIRLDLSGVRPALSVEAEICSRDKSGAAGFCFRGLSGDAKLDLQRWVASRLRSRMVEVFGLHSQKRDQCRGT